MSELAKQLAEMSPEAYAKYKAMLNDLIAAWNEAGELRKRKNA